MNNTTVTLKVNHANLVKSLHFSFTHKTTVLGELMQNARRAGAASVNFDFTPETHSLQVSDNGCGIDSLEALLTVAESGWDAALIEQEHAFGIGFLSALFACRHLTVESKSGKISVDTEQILAFKGVLGTMERKFRLSFCHIPSKVSAQVIPSRWQDRAEAAALLSSPPPA